MSEEPCGRARGRARGRVRERPEEGRAAHRPGSSGSGRPTAPGSGASSRAWGPPPAAQSSRSGTSGTAPQAVSRADETMPGNQSNGRGVHRGGPRGEPHRDSEGPATTHTSATSLNGGRGESGQRGRARGGIVAQEEVRTRPEHIHTSSGVEGDSISLVTNMFSVETPRDWLLFQYEVVFNPPIESHSLRRRLIKDHRDLLGNTRIFDGAVLFLPKRLPDDVTEVFSQLPRDGTNVRVTFKLTFELPPNHPTCLQILNIMLRHYLKMIDMKLVGRHHYSPAQAVSIDRHNMEVWPGYITSILQYETNKLLMVDIDHKILNKNTVLDVMSDVNHRWYRDPHEMKRQCMKKLIGEIVLTKYNNKTYRIDEIDWDSNPMSTFTLHNGSKVTFKDYYEKSYNKEITDLGQPLLLSRPKKKDLQRGNATNILLVPELCTLTGLSTDMREDFRVMRDIAVHTRIGPQQRCRTLQGFINNLHRNEDVRSDMAGWGVKFAKSLLEIQGRILPREELMLGANSRRIFPNHSADWSAEMRGQALRTPVTLRHWCVIFCERASRSVSDFLSALRRVSQPMGINLHQPTLVRLDNDRTMTYVKGMKNEVTRDTQLVMPVVPNKVKERYDAIKKFTCLDHPVPSQVIVAQTLSKPQQLMSIATKIAIQVNCKLGGEVWAAHIPLKGLMVVGFDVYHDSACKGQSVGGFVASMNDTLTRYYSRVTFQKSHNELISGLTPLFADALKKYHQLHGALPKRIVFYRDGVGDGQLKAVKDHEIPQLERCFGDDYKPKWTFLVVKKRISNRFFVQNRGGENPPPGTCIDKVVTRPEWYDFFLVSQAVRQGTVTPTHYNVLYDNSGMKPDHVQRLTYKLCHLYYNWQGTIRVPAPCQYAHKLAFLVGQSLHAFPSQALSDRLFFL